MKYKKPHEYLIEANTANQKKWIEWQQHREKIQQETQSMIDRGIELKKALIIGAGNCNDIPLLFLTEHFEEVVLTDIDLNSIHFARTRLPNDLQKKVKCYQWDITGLHETLMKEIDGCVKAGGGYVSIINEIINKIDSYMNHSNNTNRMLKPEWLLSWHHYDCVISAGVTSQLFAAIFGYYITEYFGNPFWGKRRKKHMQLKQLTQYFSDRFLTQHHINLLRRLIKPNGYVFLVSDVLEYRRKNQLGQKVMDVVDLLSPKLQQFYLEKGFKVTGAIASTVIDEYIHNKFSIEDQDTWIWPFGSGKHYVVQGFVLKPIVYNN